MKQTTRDIFKAVRELHLDEVTASGYRFLYLLKEFNEHEKQFDANQRKAVLRSLLVEARFNPLYQILVLERMLDLGNLLECERIFSTIDELTEECAQDYPAVMKSPNFKKERALLAEKYALYSIEKRDYPSAVQAYACAIDLTNEKEAKEILRKKMEELKEEVS